MIRLYYCCYVTQNYLPIRGILLRKFFSIGTVASLETKRTVPDEFSRGRGLRIRYVDPHAIHIHMYIGISHSYENEASVSCVHIMGMIALVHPPLRLIYQL